MSKAKIDGITERIIAKADEDLRKIIEDAITPIAQKIQWYARLPVRSAPGGTVFEADAGHLVETLRAHAFEHLCERHRVNALDEFLVKVKSLGEQVEEIQQNLVE